jgi:hypothetical protein
MVDEIILDHPFTYLQFSNNADYYVLDQSSNVELKYQDLKLNLIKISLLLWVTSIAYICRMEKPLVYGLVFYATEDSPKQIKEIVEPYDETVFEQEYINKFYYMVF